MREEGSGSETTAIWKYRSFLVKKMKNGQKLPFFEKKEKVPPHCSSLHSAHPLISLLTIKSSI
jgi:hypothetical protein